MNSGIIPLATTQKDRGGHSSQHLTTLGIRYADGIVSIEDFSQHKSLEESSHGVWQAVHATFAVALEKSPKLCECLAALTADGISTAKVSVVWSGDGTSGDSGQVLRAFKSACIRTTRKATVKSDSCKVSLQLGRGGIAQRSNFRQYERNWAKEYHQEHVEQKKQERELVQKLATKFGSQLTALMPPVREAVFRELLKNAEFGVELRKIAGESKLNSQQAAEILGIDQSLVLRYARRGTIGTKVGPRRYIFDRADIERFKMVPRPVGKRLS